MKSNLTCLYFLLITSAGVMSFNSKCEGYEIKIQSQNFSLNNSEHSISAQGNVKSVITTSNKKMIKIYCDKLEHNMKSRTFSLKGSPLYPLSIFTDKDEVLQSQEAQVSWDLKDIQLEPFEIKFGDNYTFNGKSAIRKNAQVSIMKDSHYTACKTCHNQAPFWSIKAEEIQRDEEEETISYKNIFLKIKSVPVLYLPYFSHPDPRVKRKSGFIRPILSKSNDLGYVLGTPIFYIFDSTQDMTITPVFMSAQGALLKSEYRKMLKEGLFSVDGSITRTQKSVQQISEDETPLKSLERWYIHSNADFAINNEQSIAFDLARASDTTFLARYATPLERPLLITNRTIPSYARWNYDAKSYYVFIDAHSFQTDQPDTAPLILPRLESEYFNHNELGLFRIQANYTHIQRHQFLTYANALYPKKNQRFLVNTEWENIFISSAGFVFEPKLVVSQSFYFIKTSNGSINHPESIQKTFSRFFPQGSLKTSLPLQSRFENSSYIFAPISLLIVAPELSPQFKKIPNEDSQFSDLDDISILATNRLGGYDQIDQGSKLVLGFDNTLDFDSGRKFEFFIGRSFRLDRQDVLGVTKGEADRKSDYLLRFLISYNEHLSFRSRYAYSPTLKGFRYMEHGMIFDQEKIALECAHIHLNKIMLNSPKNLAQLHTNIKFKITSEWMLLGGQLRNLNKSNGSPTLATYGAARYENECFSMELGISRSAQKARDLRPDTSFILSLNFKSISNFNFSQSSALPNHPFVNFLK
ncbi:MAG: hypothetical protein C0432_00760 [Candidatus Puniceispirillum sp.]|nr:hypothetical protein [Candidatus Pelagibacter sp.]MBA4282813.1 hypothetical protein [Candidatus Puniceispirillum sp.]